MDFVHLLHEEFEKRRKKNRNYSLRAFAKIFEKSPSQFLQVFSRKRELSGLKLYSYGKKLELSDEEICGYLIKHFDRKMLQIKSKKNEDRDI